MKTRSLISETALRRLWVGMLTKDRKDAGTPDEIVLIVNQSGADRLHHTFLHPPAPVNTYNVPAGPPLGQNRGRADLYSLDVLGNGIDSNLDDTYIRIGIRGRNAWLPEHLVLWGETVANEVVPFGIETDLNTWLSTDKDEGPTSLPIRRIPLGNPMMPIDRILVVMETDANKKSGTEDVITVQIFGPSPDYWVNDWIPRTPQLDQDRGKANLYFLDSMAPFNRANLAPNSIRIGIMGEDNWEPKRFFIFGIDTAQGRPGALVPLLYIDDWDKGPLSTKPSLGKPYIDFSPFTSL